MTKRELKRENCILLKCISFYINYFKARHGDKEDVTAFQKDRFPFIPADSNRVLHLLNEAVKYYGKKGISTKFLKFLDAGCGIGNVLAIANLMGFQAYGVEIDDKSIRVAEKLVTNPYEIYFKIIKRDILTFKNYSHYDVIYFYYPLCDSKKQKEFETKLTNDMKVGAIIIQYGLKDALKNDPRFKRISRKKEPIWIKIKK